MKKIFSIVHNTIPILIVIPSTFLGFIENWIWIIIIWILCFLCIFLSIGKSYPTHKLFRSLFSFNKIIGKYECALNYEAYDYVIENKQVENKQRKIGKKKIRLEIKYVESNLIAQLKTDESSSIAKFLFSKKEINQTILFFEYKNEGSIDQINKKLKPHQGYMQLMIINKKIIKGNYLNDKPGTGTLTSFCKIEK